MVQRFANTAGVSRLAYEMMNSSFADYMQALRLDACRRDFQSQEHAARSITDIALSWGYNSPAHFSRVFRKQFGASPSEWRARARPCIHR